MILNQTQLNNIINSSENIAVFLGAGCSIESGCFGVSDLIYDFKKRIYCNENNISYSADKCEEGFKITLDEYFKNDEFESAYSYYFERCFNTLQSRREYIKKTFQNKEPSLGYLCFAELIRNKKIKHILTTNFDKLIEKAIRKIDINYDYTLYSAGKKPITDSETIIYELHGDYNYDELSNTEEETKCLDKSVMEDALKITPSLILVVGYSGLDKSIISYFDEITAKNPNASIIWCAYGDKPKINEKVKVLLDKNQINNRICCFNGFESLFIQYYKVYLNNNEYINGKRTDPFNNFSFSSGYKFNSMETISLSSLQMHTITKNMDMRCSS